MSDPPATGGPALARRAAPAISALFLANGLVAGCWAVLVPVLMNRLGIDATRMGLLILVCSAVGLLFILFSAGLIAALGSRTVATGGALLLAAAVLALVHAPDFRLAGFALFGFFLAMAFMDVAMNVNGAAVESHAGAAVMSGFHGFWSLGCMLGAGAGGYLLAAAGPAMLGLATAIAVAVLSLAAMPFLVPRAGEPRPREAPPGRRRFAPPPVLAIYLIGLLALTSFIAEGSINDWSALYLRRSLDSGIAASGLAFSGFSLAMMLGRFTGDAVRDRLGARRAIRFSGLVAAIGFAVAGSAPGVAVAVAGFTLAGLGCANLVPVAFSAAGRVRGLRPATGIAIAAGMGYAGMIAGPGAFGAIGERFGFAPVYLFFALALLAATALAGFVDEPDGLSHKRA